MFDQHYVFFSAQAWYTLRPKSRTPQIIWRNFAELKAMNAKFPTDIQQSFLNQMAKLYQNCSGNSEPAERITTGPIADGDRRNQGLLCFSLLRRSRHLQ